MKLFKMESLTENGNALATLERVYPQFKYQIKDLRVCDFGCGAGEQTIAMSEYARSVVGTDLNLTRLPELPWPHNVTFTENTNGYRDHFDVVISQNSMEHFADPFKTLKLMKGLLVPGGRLMITFGPPWYAPYGAHMMDYVRLPWIHMLLPEKAVMHIRNKFRPNNQVKHYDEVEGGLNKMTVKKFEQLIDSLNMPCIYRKHEGVKKADFLTKAPGLRELFTNHISVVLIKGG